MANYLVERLGWMMNLKKAVWKKVLMVTLAFVVTIISFIGGAEGIQAASKKGGGQRIRLLPRRQIKWHWH